MLRVHLPPMTPLHRKAARLDHVECFESTEGRDALESFWEEAINGRSEGLMIKVCLPSCVFFLCFLPNLSHSY